MTRFAVTLAATAALVTIGIAGQSVADRSVATSGALSAPSSDMAPRIGETQLAQAGWYPRRYGYYGPRRYRRYYGPPPRRAYYGPRYGPGYGYRPPGVVSPGTVRLRLLARGYYAIRAIRYVPTGPRRYGRGPGARFPGHYIAVARRIGVTYRFRLNPYTGRPYARVRIY